MALVELLFIAILVYIVFSKIASPFRRGYREREKEREHERRFDGWNPPSSSKIDRSHTQDAEFKDIP